VRHAFDSASEDCTAAVRCVGTQLRLAGLARYSQAVIIVAMRTRFVVTRSRDKKYRVHDAITFQCTRVIDKDPRRLGLFACSS
jgi:hypothetical protein